MARKLPWIPKRHPTSVLEKVVSVLRLRSGKTKVHTNNFAHHPCFAHSSDAQYNAHPIIKRTLGDPGFRGCRSAGEVHLHTDLEGLSSIYLDSSFLPFASPASERKPYGFQLLFNYLDI
eukprot:6459979-Amphidinium_carterae.6